MFKISKLLNTKIGMLFITISSNVNAMEDEMYGYGYSGNNCGEFNSLGEELDHMQYEYEISEKNSKGGDDHFNKIAEKMIDNYINLINNEKEKLKDHVLNSEVYKGLENHEKKLSIKNLEGTYCEENTSLTTIKEKISEINEENRVIFQSDTEGKLCNILAALELARIIKIGEFETVYYDILEGIFVHIMPVDGRPYIELNLPKININFKGTYINLGDIVDRCQGKKQCLISLLTLLYVKQELGDRIKLICGNHEIAKNYGNEETRCCEDVKLLIMLIVFKAIEKGQIIFLDKIKIGEIEYILSHKALLKNDIANIVNFIVEKKDQEMSEKEREIRTITNGEKINKNESSEIKIKKLKSAISEIEEEIKKFKNIKTSETNNIYELIVPFNTIFKGYVISFFESLEGVGVVQTYFNNTHVVDCLSIFDVVSGKIISSTRLNQEELGKFIKNQLFGHDHIIDPYQEIINSVDADNTSCQFTGEPRANIFVSDRSKHISKCLYIKVDFKEKSK